MGSLNKFELHACGQQLASSFATLLLTLIATRFDTILGYI